MRAAILCWQVMALVAVGAVLAVSAMTTSRTRSPATYGVLSLRAVTEAPLDGPEDHHAHDYGELRASTAASASTCDKDIDAASTIGGVTFVAAQDNNICTNGDIDLYWQGGQLYVVQAGGVQAAFTISRINSDGTPTLVAQRFWTAPYPNTADVMAFRQGGRQYLSLALEKIAGPVESTCGLTIVDVTDAPDITDADTVAQVTGTGWCSVHNNFVESIDGEGRYIYLTANAAKDMRVLDIGNLSSIAEVGRYTHPDAANPNAGAFVHDVTVIDHGGAIGRRVYVSYWDAGLMILDAADVTPGIVDAGSAKQPLNPDHSIDPSGALHIHHAFPTMDGSRVFIQDEFVSVATNQALDGDEPIQMWDITNPAAPVYVDGIDLGSPLQPLINPPHNMEIRYDLDVDGDGQPDRDRLYVGWYRGGLQAFDFVPGGFVSRPLYHQVQTEAADASWDGAWAVRVERIGGNVYTFQSDRRYGLIVERVGVGAPVQSVGGIAEQPRFAVLPWPAASSRSGALIYAGAAAAGAALLACIGGLIWGRRRRV